MSRPLSVLYAPFSKAAASNSELVAAVTGSKIRVIGLQAKAAAANTITIATSTGGALWGPAACTANDLTIDLPPCAVGYCETDASDGVFITTSTTAAFGGGIQYQLV